MKGSLKDLAMFLGVSYTTVRNLQAKGLPLEKPGRRGVAAVIDLQEAKRWYIEEFQVPAEWREERERLLAEKMKLQELAARRKALYQQYVAREQNQT